MIIRSPQEALSLWLLPLEGCRVKASPGKKGGHLPISRRGLRLSIEAQRLAHRHCTDLVFTKAFDAKSFFGLAHTAEKLPLDTPEAQSAGSRSYVGVGSLSEELLADAFGKVQDTLF